MEKGIRMLCEAGFDALDFSMFSLGNENDPLNTEGNAYIENIKRRQMNTALLSIRLTLRFHPARKMTRIQQRCSKP